MSTLRDASHESELNFDNEKAMDTPTQNRKKGKTRSHGVHPSQAACLNGGKTVLHEPGLLTRIISATVIPRKTSNERYLFINRLNSGSVLQN